MYGKLNTAKASRLIETYVMAMRGIKEIEGVMSVWSPLTPETPDSPVVFVTHFFEQFENYDREHTQIKEVFPLVVSMEHLPYMIRIPITVQFSPNEDPIIYLEEIVDYINGPVVSAIKEVVAAWRELYAVLPPETKENLLVPDVTPGKHRIGFSATRPWTYFNIATALKDDRQELTPASQLPGSVYAMFPTKIAAAFRCTYKLVRLANQVETLDLALNQQPQELQGNSARDILFLGVAATSGPAAIFLRFGSTMVYNATADSFTGLCAKDGPVESIDKILTQTQLLLKVGDSVSQKLLQQYLTSGNAK